MLPGLVALVALWLVPGLALVAAPWPAVPLLSVSFWLASWGLGDLLGLSREASLSSTLLLFTLLVLLRLPRLPAPRWPSLAALGVAVTALLGLAGAWLAPVPRGPQAPGQALAARLLVARDGRPLTQAPFWPRRDFETPPGTALLAADLGLLAGVPVSSALLLVSLGTRGLLGCALLLAFRRLGAGPQVSSGAVLAPWLLHALWPFRAEPRELAVSLGLAGWALLARGSTRSPAAAAGLLLAGAVSAEARVGGLCLLAAVLQLLWAWRRSPGGERPRHAARALVAALFLSAGGLGWRHGLPLPVLPAPAPQPRLDQHDLAAFRWLREASPLAARVCCADAGRAAWLPALAERPAAQPGESCSLAYSRGFPPFVSGPAAFTDGTVQVVEIP